MKKFKYSKVSVIVLVLVLTLSVAGSIALATLAPGAVDLGASDNFAILAGGAITDASTLSTITGDVGLHPAAGSFLTGFSCTQMALSSKIYDNNAGYTGGFDSNVGCLITDLGGVGILQPAKDDLVAAYTDASTRGALPDIPTNLATQNLTPGVYHAASGTFTISGAGTLTLDGGGDPNAVFIFKADTTLVTGGASSVVLTNGAQACNVFWAVGTSATLNNTTFVGTIMAQATISDAGDSTVNGRLLADADDNGTGDVTLINTDVTVPSCAPSLTLIKNVNNAGGGTAAATAWTLTATGTGGSPTNLSGSTPVNSNVVFSNAAFKAGTYDLAESGGSSHYTGSVYRCVINGGAPVASNSITLVSGDDAICTVTNTYQAPSGGGISGSSRISLPTPATLHVVKQVVNNSGGAAVASLFNLHVKNAGIDIVGSPAPGAGAPGTSYLVSAGTYTVSEDVGNGSYLQSFSGNCDSAGNVTLAPGDNKTCTITNDDISSAVIPQLPKTGFPPQSRSASWDIIIPSVISIVLLALYVTRKNRVFN